jgi:hypothetical protein
MRSLAGSWGFFWALALFHLWPIWSGAWFVTIDGPCHLSNARILLDLLRGDAFTEQFFALHRSPEPYWTGPLVMAGLMALAPAWLAEKLVFSLAVIGTAWSFRRLCLAITPDRPWLPLLAMPLLLHYAIAMGFISFCLSLPLLLLALHAAWERGAHARAGFPWKLLLLLTLLYFTHLTSFLMAAACSGSIMFWNGLRNRAWLREVAHAALAAVPGALLSAWYLFGNPSAQGAAAWVPIGDRLQWLLNGRAYNALGVEGESFASALSAAPVVLLCAWLMFTGWRTERNKRIWLLLMVGAFVVFLLLPDVAAGGSSASPRALLYFMLLGSLAMVACPAPRLAVASATSVLLLGDAWHTVLQARTAQSLSLEAEELITGAAAIGEHAVVLPLNYSGNWVHSNLSNYVAATRRATVLDNFVATAPFSPVQWRPEMQPFAVGDFSTCNAPCVEVDRYEALTAVPISHVLLWRAPMQSPDSCLLSTLEQVKHGQQHTHAEVQVFDLGKAPLQRAP